MVHLIILELEVGIIVWIGSLKGLFNPQLIKFIVVKLSTKMMIPMVVASTLRVCG